MTLVKTVIGGIVTDPDAFLLVVLGPLPGNPPPPTETAMVSGVPQVFAPGDYQASETPLPLYAPGDWGLDCNADGTITMVAGIDYVCTITNIDPGTTTTTQGTTTTTPTTTPPTTVPGTTTTAGFETTTTDPGGTTTTTLVLGPDLPNTGAGHLFPIWLGSLGLLMLGAGLVLLAPRNRPQWVTWSIGF